MDIFLFMYPPVLLLWGFACVARLYVWFIIGYGAGRFIIRYSFILKHDKMGPQVHEEGTKNTMFDIQVYPVRIDNTIELYRSYRCHIIRTMK